MFSKSALAFVRKTITDPLQQFFRFPGGSLRGEAPHNSQVGGSGGEGGSPPPQEMRGGLGGRQPPSKIAKSENTFVAAMYSETWEVPSLMGELEITYQAIRALPCPLGRRS